jgi:hypothetical protein
MTPEVTLRPQVAAPIRRRLENVRRRKKQPVFSRTVGRTRCIEASRDINLISTIRHCFVDDDKCSIIQRLCFEADSDNGASLCDGQGCVIHLPDTVRWAPRRGSVIGDVNGGRSSIVNSATNARLGHQKTGAGNRSWVCVAHARGNIALLGGNVIIIIKGSIGLFVPDNVDSLLGVGYFGQHEIR